MIVDLHRNLSVFYLNNFLRPRDFLSDLEIDLSVSIFYMRYRNWLERWTIFSKYTSTILCQTISWTCTFNPYPPYKDHQMCVWSSISKVFKALFQEGHVFKDSNQIDRSDLLDLNPNMWLNQWFDLISFAIDSAKLELWVDLNLTIESTLNLIKPIYISILRKT